MSQAFLERLRDYLNERMGEGEFLFGKKNPFEIEPPWTFEEEWVVRGSECFVPCITGYKDGTIMINAFGLGKPGDLVGSCLIKYRYRRRLREAKSKEEKEKVYELMDEAKAEIYEDFVNRRNLEKHLKMPYKSAFIKLLWYDEVVRRILKEYGVEVTVWIEDDPRFEWDIGIISKFDGKGMDEEEKFEEIKRRVEALILAYKLAEPRPQYEKEYSEFRKALLEKYGPRKKGRRGNPPRR